MKKLFRTIQKNYARLGIVPNQSKCFRAKFCLVMACLVYCSSTTSSVLFLIFEANTFTEFVNNIYITSAAIMINIFFIVIIIERDKLFEFIINIENLIDESE